jgi:asparagine synthase (glutamine-hydrolysing)
MYFELKNWLVYDILTRTDRMTMAHSMEGRVPFLDHELVGLSSKVHPSLKLKGTNEKFILKEAMKGMLPKEIIKRKKQRFFTPIDHWFGDDFKELSRQRLLDSEFLNGLFKKESLTRLLKYEGNLSYKLFLKRNKLLKQYYARQIWCLVVLDIWNDIFINDAKHT